MTGETRMSLAVAGKKRQAVQTAHHLAECSRNGGTTGNDRRPVLRTTSEIFNTSS